MRILPVLVILFVSTLAGCLLSGPVSDIAMVRDPCGEGVCLAEGRWPDEADAPVGATPVLVFEADMVPWVSELVRTPDGPAWIATRSSVDQGTRSVVEAYDDNTGMLHRYAVPPDTIASGLLAVRDGLLFTVAPTGSRDNGTLVRWDLDAGMIHVLPLPDVPLPWRAVAVGQAGVLVTSQRAVVTGQEALWFVKGDDVHRIRSDDGRFIAGALHGSTLYAVELAGDTYRLIMTSMSAGSDRHVLWYSGNDTVLGVHASAGRIAFSTLAPGDGPWDAVTWEVDPRSHTVSPLTTGWDARFVGNLVYHVGQDPGSKPYVRAWNPALGGVAPAFFLPMDRAAWAATAEGVWWLDTPTTDHRFDGMPNPTSYSTVLYRR